jgi:hypothetical protein
MSGAWCTWWEGSTTYTAFIGKSEENRPLQKTSRTYADNIEINLNEKEYDCVDLIRLFLDMAH